MIHVRTSALQRIAVIIALLAAGGAMAARQGPDAPEFHNSLQGKMLVAKPSMPDRRFAQAIILIVRHDATGAFGLVINRPLGSVEIKDKAADAHPDSIHLPAFAGGPVEPNRAFVIHSTDYRLDTTMPAAKGLAVTADKRILADIVAGNGPKRLLYVVGYSGWRKGQLEDEMRRNDWYITSADARIVFGPEDSKAKWEKAIKLRIEGI